MWKRSYEDPPQIRNIWRTGRLTSVKRKVNCRPSQSGFGRYRSGVLSDVLYHGRDQPTVLERFGPGHVDRLAATLGGAADHSAIAEYERTLVAKLQFGNEGWN